MAGEAVVRKQRLDLSSEECRVWFAAAERSGTNQSQYRCMRANNSATSSWQYYINRVPVAMCFRIG